MTAEIITSRDALRENLGDTHPGLVPTMGALHRGHQSLIARSARENPVTVVSIFVNPIQFSHQGDLDRYPRDFESDAAFAAASGADMVFAPAVVELYPPGFDTTVEVGAIAERWEGESRPGHFRGVATVVAILLNLVRPARSYFGEKDYQQLQVVRQLHRDLALPGEIIACPTIRDGDGLALSSRNALLSSSERDLAQAIPRAIATVQAAARAGERIAERLREAALAALEDSNVAVDYVAIVDGESLEPLSEARPGSRVLVAAKVGDIRLIDNDAIEFTDTAG